MKDCLIVGLLQFVLVVRAARNLTCRMEEFPCDNLEECVKRWQWCNDAEDCSDDSDEKYCITSKFFPDPNRCATTHFLCRDGKCFPISSICDGYKDCKGGDDEEMCDDVEDTSTKGSFANARGPTARHPSVPPLMKPKHMGHNQSGVWETPIHLPEHRTNHSGQLHDLGADKGEMDSNAIAMSSFEITQKHQKETELDDPVGRGIKWLLSMRTENYGWGKSTPLVLVALALAQPDFFAKGGTEVAMMKKRLVVELAEDVINNRTHPLNMEFLASYINAMLATCQDPHNFKRIDLVQELRRQIHSPLRRAVNPSIYLTLCVANASEYNDARKVTELMNSPLAQRWPDMQILSIMALACVLEKQNRKVEQPYKSAFLRAAARLIDRMSPEVGNFGSIYSTALAVQALSAVFVRSGWDSNLSRLYLQAHQQKDGSFGDFLSTYYILPALAGTNLLTLSTMPCGEDDENAVAYSSFNSKAGGSKFVRYSLFQGTPVATAHTTQLQVPANTSLLDIVKMAEDEDPKFRVFPNDGDHIVFWYRQKTN